VAQSALAYLYLAGLGVQQDDKQAVTWFRRAAERDYALAQYYLGWMHEYGRGVVQDYTEAIYW
jgi:uncharacterized protein